MLSTWFFAAAEPLPAATAEAPTTSATSTTTAAGDTGLVSTSKPSKNSITAGLEDLFAASPAVSAQPESAAQPASQPKSSQPPKDVNSILSLFENVPLRPYLVVFLPFCVTRRVISNSVFILER